MADSPPDLDRFAERLYKRDAAFFDPAVPVTVTRAPGRLDVMGGIADYSGALVLQRPIAEATFAALQPAEAPAIEIVSQSLTIPAKARTFAIDLSSLAPGGEPVEYASAQQLFTKNRENHWAGYVAGAFLVLMRERGARFESGAKIFIGSSVPEGKGVASSAALEVAAMQAIAAAFGIPLDSYALALLCQRVENLVAGAPCGVMDQMASVFGKPDSLMALLCRPAELQAPVALPPEIAFWGLDSGEKHDVGGANYHSVRAAAFMGYQMICESRGSPPPYLANLDPAEFDQTDLPEEMTGEAFLARFRGTPDPVTRVDPSITYKVRRAAAHPVYEHQRVMAFRDLLLDSSNEGHWISMGELMYRSHASYSACGLGSRGTDAIVELVRSEGPANGLYGARITGGGSGGTVAILGRADAHAAIARVQERYRALTGYAPVVFSGSSEGAAYVGPLRLNL